jgi:hypothetical protein
MDAVTLSPDAQDYAVKTWRYLRLAMVALALGLLVSVVFEWRTVPRDCFQTSISSYYYTPVRGYLVAALVSIGVCLFCLKGSTDVEDVLLNLAGMFAAVIALVPTPDPGTCSSLPDLATVTTDRDPNIANNVTALIAVGLFGVLVLARLARRDPPPRRSRIGYAAGALLWAGAALVFAFDRPDFTGSAHDIAAYAMFGCIVGVVLFNAIGHKQPVRSRKNPYTLVAVAMGISAVVIAAVALAGWAYWIIAAETAFLVLFAIFWVIQTRELWDQGLRPQR